MTWISVTPQIFAALCIILVPGGLLAFAGFRLRWLAALAVAPVLSVSLVAVAAVAADFAGIGWSLLPVAVLTVLATAAAAGLRFLWTRREEPTAPAATRDPAIHLAEAAAVLGAALLVGRRLVFAFGNPENFSQTFDNIFHLNAIRYIAETGSASSLSIGSMTGIGFYPSGWHGLVSLVNSLAASPIPVSVNAVNLVIGAVVWPLGCIFLVQQIAGRKTVPTLIAGVLSAAFGAFPLLLVDFGVLYPNFLGVSLIPAVLGILISVLGLARRTSSLRLMWLLLILAVPGLALAHPSAFLAVTAFSVPLVIAAAIRRVRMEHSAKRAGRSWLYIAAFVLYAVGVVMLWNAVRPEQDTLIWLPYQTQAQAMGEVLAGAPLLSPVSWGVLVLSLFGFAALILRRAPWWTAGIYVMGGFLYVVATGAPDGDFRDLITGGWYTDNNRLAALLPIVILPVAVLGGTLIVEGLDKALWRPAMERLSARGWRADMVRGATAAALVLVVLVTALATQRENVRAAARSAAGNYVLGEEAPLVSRDEYELMERLDGKVEEDARFVGNPWTGSSLVYALAGYHPMQLHTIAALDQGEDEIYADLRNALTDPDVCPALEAEQVGYVLDFGDQEIHGGTHPYPGLEDLESSGVVTLVDSEGEAKLYRITACG
ncbi:hypothetical protein GD627_05705 [Arthrobacter yangruifuii]|uniref:Uncharacterized protein n=1 Tax=Arthrobacter yangruifuii TaxID=2606616 RepID=A0A5N6MUP4_9MICC|nr:DUF6541 family protein [Arthrobacter yangruifuii]KAD4060526.1 hypothetical protein GD627_05705 [Arthrobacter yangruifuii]